MGYREEQYTHIYDELVDKLGEGTWNVHVGGVNHVVEVGTGSNPFLMIYLARESRLYSVKLKAGHISLNREPKEYAETILTLLDPKRVNPNSAAQVSGSLHILTKIENELQRTFSSNLFKTIFNVIVENKLWEIPIVFKKDLHGICLCKTDPQQESNEFLSIGRHETDKEILGRLLCGVYLSNEYDKQKSLKSIQEERT